MIKQAVEISTRHILPSCSGSDSELSLSVPVHGDPCLSRFLICGKLNATVTSYLQESIQGNRSKDNCFFRRLGLPLIPTLESSS